MLEGRFELLERERSVDHRMQVMRCDERAHAQEVGARAHEDALYVGGFPEQRACPYLTVVAGEAADNRQRSPECETSNGLLQRALASNIDHNIGAMPVGQLEDASAPVRDALVVDSIVRRDGLRALQFVVRAARQNDPCARGGRELHREDRDPAGALDQHYIALVGRPPPDRCHPAGQAGGRQRRRLFVAQSRRGGRNGGVLQDYEVSEHTLSVGAERLVQFW